MKEKDKLKILTTADMFFHDSAFQQFHEISWNEMGSNFMTSLSISPELKSAGASFE